MFNDRSKKVPHYYVRPGPGSYLPDQNRDADKTVEVLSKHTKIAG